jgi:protein MBA1
MVEGQGDFWVRFDSAYCPVVVLLVRRGYKRLTRELLSRHYMGYFHVSPRADFQTAAVPSIAKSLYREMYTAFSAGNLSPIAHKLCENIHTSLEQRIATRGPNIGIIWTLHQWTSAPKVVSHKYMPMSLEDNKDKTKQTTIQQVCVRMQSLQSLKKVKRVKQGKETIEVLEEGSSAEPKEVVEYLVVQRLCKRGKMGPWMVWGTTTESNAEEVLQIE